MNKKRMGRFWISINLLQEHPEEVIEMFYKLGILVLRAETMLHRDAVEYIASSPNFKEQEPYFIPLDYELIIHKDSKGNVDYSVQDYKLL